MATTTATTMMISTTVVSSTSVDDSGVSYEDWPHKISDTGYKAVAFLLTVVWVFGTLFNLTGISVFVLNKKLLSPTNVFVMCLLINDLLMSFFPCFMAMSSAWKQRWLYGHVGCIFEGFMVYFLGLSSMYLMAAVSVDRYVIIAKPLLGPKITHKVAIAGIGACWVGGFLWSTFPLFGWNEYVMEGAGISCSVVWESSNPTYTSFIFTIFVFCLLLPLVVMAFSYFNVYMTIRTMARNQTFDKNSRVAKRNMRVERKMAKTVMLMLSAFLVCWLPYAIFSFIIVFQGSHVVSAELATYPAILAKSQGLMNPVLYVATNKQFREAFYDLLPCSALREALIKREQDKPESEDESDGAEVEGGSTAKANRGSKARKGSSNAVYPADSGVPATKIQEDEDTAVENLAIADKANKE